LPRRVRLPVGGHLPVVKKGDIVGDLPRKMQVVRDDYHRIVFLNQSTCNLQNSPLRVKCACRLVKEQRIRLHVQDAGYSRPLLLAARKRGREAVLLVGQLNFCKKREGTFWTGSRTRARPEYVFVPDWITVSFRYLTPYGFR
jgi:hypothetical protein